MSFRAKVNGFTSWVNMRLTEKGIPLENILKDLNKGIYLKTFLEEITGNSPRRLESMDGLSLSQKQIRFDWFVDELKKRGFLPSKYRIDTKLLAVLKADEVFNLCWQIVQEDLVYVWEEGEFLQMDDSIIIAEPFQLKRSPLIRQKTPEPSPPFKRASCVKSRRAQLSKPSAESCMLQLVRDHLKLVKEGRQLSVECLEDLLSSRVLCGLVNSFAPGTFTSEVLLDDRWTINLALKCAGDLFRFPTGFDSQDLMEADAESIGAYMCSFFMLGYKFKQARGVKTRHGELVKLLRTVERELEHSPNIAQSMSDLRKRKDLVKRSEQWKEELEWIELHYDVPSACEWMRQAEDVRAEIRSRISEKSRQRFDVLTVPRNMTINDLVNMLGINLSLTCGNGFFTTAMKESVWVGRKVVLKDLKTGDFCDDFSGAPQKKSVRELLGAKAFEVINVSPSHFLDKYEIFFESQSRNKMLKAGSRFLYQVFPGSKLQCQRLFMNAAKTGVLETVEKLAVFFHYSKEFLNCQEQASGNGALHLASRHGHTDVVRYLLRCGVNIDLRNQFGSTPLFLAVESLNKPVCQLLIEWNANIGLKNRNSKTAFDLLRNEEMKRFFLQKHSAYKSLTSAIMKGDKKALGQAVKSHLRRENTFTDLESRCIRGNTLMHVAASTGDLDVLETLFRERVDCSLVNNSGATPLHVASDTFTIEALVTSGADIDAVDSNGDTALHMRCTGKSKAADLDCIETLIRKRASLTKRNFKGMMPVHCCAQHGRSDIIRLLLEEDVQDRVRFSIEGEGESEPPSLLYLALSNDYYHCANWLSDQDFCFKPYETDTLLKSILTEEIKSSVPGDAVKFLIENGGSVDALNDDRDTALHLAIVHCCGPDVIEALLAGQADVNATNRRMQTPLFLAAKHSQIYTASLLLEAGADFRQKDTQGLCAFDLISDFDEWISSGYFSEDMQLRMQAHSLKQARELVRAISKKVQHTRQAINSRAGGIEVPALPALQLSPSHSFATLVPVARDSSNALPPLTAQKVSVIQSVVFKNRVA